MTEHHIFDLHHTFDLKAQKYLKLFEKREMVLSSPSRKQFKLPQIFYLNLSITNVSAIISHCFPPPPQFCMSVLPASQLHIHRITSHHQLAMEAESNTALTFDPSPDSEVYSLNNDDINNAGTMLTIKQWLRVVLPYTKIAIHSF